MTGSTTPQELINTIGLLYAHRDRFPDLNFAALLREYREACADGTADDWAGPLNPDGTRGRDRVRRFRRMAIDAGILRVGELVTDRDSESLAPLAEEIFT